MPVGGIRIGTAGVPGNGHRDPARRRKRDPGARTQCVRRLLEAAEEKPARRIDADGWLHTGDCGEIDADGYVAIRDRLKDIIITSGGKNITPSNIENHLKFSPYISDAVVVGDGRNYLTCLIMIDQDNVAKFAQDQQVPYTDFASMTRAPEIVQLIQAEIEQVNDRLARVEQIKDVPHHRRSC